jgi:hypothetical protein
MVMFHVHHLFKKRLVGKSRRRKSRGLEGMPLFKKISNTTNMVINSVLITALLDTFVPLFYTSLYLVGHPVNFRLLLLAGCGVVFPIILIRKIFDLKELDSVQRPVI